MSAIAKVQITFEVTFTQPWDESVYIGKVRELTYRSLPDLAARIASVGAGVGNITMKPVSIGKELTVVFTPEAR